MRKAFILLVLAVCLFGGVGSVEAQTSDSTTQAQAEQGQVLDLQSLLMATEPAETATESSSIVKKITEKSTDLTETQGEAKGKLEQFVLENLTGKLKVTNFLRWSIRGAVMEGVPANTIVLVLMFPIVTALIAASRHLVGLRGFGIFTPALVAVGFLATGLTAGFILFFIILTAATFGRVFIRKLRMPYMPRTSLLLWLVAMAVLLVLLISPYINMEDLAKLSIFPILLMVLLAESFIEVQVKRSRAQAIEMTLETLLLAVAGYFVMNLEIVQKFVLLNPELIVLGTALFNVFLGRFGGLRLLEYWRFRKLLD